MRTMGGWGQLLRLGVLPVCATLLLAGCASMPSSGEVREVGDGQHGDSDAQVRVFGIPPHPGESATEIVSGFMEATTSGETDFATAKKYLSNDQAKHWDPYGRVTVLSGVAPPEEDDVSPGRKEGYTTVDLSGTKAAVVDTKHAYQPEQGAFQTSFHMIKQNNEWRIGGLQDGLVLAASDFQRIYRSANMYYFARLGLDSRRPGSPRETLVADPIYLRDQTDLLESTVSALLSGPTDWLAPVVATAAPAGVRLDTRTPDHGVSLDDSQHLKVRLDRAADRLGGEQCLRLAAQLFATVQAQASAKLASAEVDRANGSPACTLPSRSAQTYGPGNMVGSSARQYLIGSDQHQLLELSEDSTVATPVTGPFGSSKADLGSVAVRRDERMAAGVRTDGREMFVGSLIDDQPLGDPVLTSGVKDGLSAPSWDGFGDLWVADRNPDAARVIVLRDGTGQPRPVRIPGLSGRVQALRVASDGVRIALVVDQNGVRTLQLGRIERDGTPHSPEFTVSGLRTLTPPGESVTSVSWAGASKLVVLGREFAGVQQIQYVSTDGSAAPALEGIGEATSVAASENQNRPLMASYNGSVYWLPMDANWKQVTPKAGSPVYPG